MSVEHPVGKVIAHVDLDAFYAQVEVSKISPTLIPKSATGLSRV